MSIFTDETKRNTERMYRECRDLSPELRSRLEETLCTEEELLVLKLFYCTLPVSDIGYVSTDTFLSFARHGIFLRENVPSVISLPDDIFINDILCPRAGSERIDDCRPFFYGRLENLISLPEEERFLEANRFCASHMTYKSADGRTQSPLTSYYSGDGRCGEESVFLVSVLRSIGIPARQVYVPLWAHCDDNHAWAEAYVNGKWHFTGACEYQPVTDLGWFNSAASRAPFVHCRTYFPYDNEKLIGRDGACYVYNETERYTDTCSLEITLLDQNGIPVPEENVYADVLNTACLTPAEILKTDENGVCRADAGICTLTISAYADDAEAHETVYPKPGEKLDVKLVLKPRTETLHKIQQDYTAKNPDSPKVSLTADQKKIQREAAAQAEEKRREFISSFAEYSDSVLNPTLRERVRNAGKNSAEVINFLRGRKERERAESFLLALSSKDLRDSSPEVWASHLDSMENPSPEEIKYVLCPRIGNEETEDFRKEIMEYFSPDELFRFKRNPRSIYHFLKERFGGKTDRFFSQIDETPLSVLRTGCGDEMALKILSVAILRTLLIPSMIHPANGEVFANLGNGFVFLDDKEHGKVYFSEEKKEKLLYGVNFTVSKLGRKGYEPVFLAGAGEEVKDAELEAGRYRAVTRTRMPSGKQLAEVTYFSLKADEILKVNVNVRKGDVTDMISCFPLPQETVKEASLQKGEGGLLIYTAPGEEPTEHALNELAEMRGELHDILKVTVLKTEDELTGEGAARAVFLEPGIYPILILYDKNLSAIYAEQGYRVGSIRQMKDIAREAERIEK